MKNSFSLSIVREGPRKGLGSMLRRSSLVSLMISALLISGFVFHQNASANGYHHDTAHWVSAWGFSQRVLAPDTVTVENATVRMVARPTISGSAVRVTLQNTFGEDPVEIGAAYVGLRATVETAVLVPESNHQLTFAGAEDVMIPAGGAVTSDPVSLKVRAQEDVAVSLYLPGTPPISQHTNARVTSFLTANGAGNLAAQETADNFTETTTDMYWVAAIDVLAGPKDSAIVCLGDSITDGTGSTTDGYDRWHDFLALRLYMDSKDQRSTVNEGIGGNRINPDDTSTSPPALERLDRDVLSRAGVSHVIFFEGTNDIAHDHTADEVITGSQEIIERVHAAGLKIIGVTIIPRHNSAWTAEMTEFRHVVNDWIRHKARFDAVIDFDKLVRDPNNPDLFNPIYDRGDHIHPNVYGYLIMGQSIDLELFKKGAFKFHRSYDDKRLGAGSHR